jgi:hypothetical protein
MSQMAPQWNKSSRCDGSQCVEVANLPDAAAVRDSTKPESHLVFDRGSWHALMQDLRSGRI